MSVQRYTEIKCAKCGQRNSAEEDFCVHCQASLFVTCPQCGYLNRRSQNHCAECGQRLHRPLWRLRYRIARLPLIRTGLNPWLLLLLVILLGLLYKVIAFLANMG